MSSSTVLTCTICGKRSCRAFGVIVGIELTAGGWSTRPAVLGYCAAHRSEVVGAHLVEMSSQGVPRLLTDPPADVRSDTVDSYLRFAFDLVASAMSEQDFVGADVSMDRPPQECPHCGAGLVWDSGPHVTDARALGAARAWECPGCGAAGMLAARG